MGTTVVGTLKVRNWIPKGGGTTWNIDLSTVICPKLP